MVRKHSAATYNALKTAFKLLVQDLGGLEAAATVTRVQRSQLSDYSNINHAVPSFAPADIILDLETVAGTPHVTAALARSQGYELVPVEAHTDHELSVLMAHLGRDVSGVFATASEALADSVITEAEAHDLLRGLDQVCGAARAAMASLRRRHLAPA